MLWVLKKKRLNEMVLLSTQNMLKWWVREYLQFYAENFCLSKPVDLYCFKVFNCWKCTKYKRIAQVLYFAHFVIVAP